MNYLRSLYLATTTTGFGGILYATLAQKWSHNLIKVNAQPECFHERDEDEYDQPEPERFKIEFKTKQRTRYNLDDDEEDLFSSKPIKIDTEEEHRSEHELDVCDQSSVKRIKLDLQENQRPKRQIDNADNGLYPSKRMKTDQPIGKDYLGSPMAICGSPVILQEDLPPEPTLTWIDYFYGGPLFPHPKHAKRSLIEYKDFVLCYDNETRTPMWTIECIESQHANLGTERFNLLPARKEPRVPTEFRTDFNDYRPAFKKYQMQHLAEHDIHTADMSDPCVFTNVVLQRSDPQCKPTVTLWDEFRTYIAFLTKGYCFIYIMTGPLYLPQPRCNGSWAVKYRYINGKRIAVPTHFFKVIMCKDPHKDAYHLECYKFENKIHDTINISKLVVNRHELEKETGFLIFDQISDCQIKRDKTHRNFLTRYCEQQESMDDI